ncbi:restriction endonuclease subunit S [Deinococcus depolymerans]
MRPNFMRLTEVASVRQGPAVPKDESTNGRCLSVGVTDLVSLMVGPNSLQPAPCPNWPQKHMLRDGEIIVSNRNRPLRASVFEGQWADLPVVAANQCLVISPNQDMVRPVYLAGLLRSGYGQVLVDSLYTVSTSISLINIKAFNDLAIPLPPLEVQDLIAQTFIEHQEYVSALTEEITLANTLLTATLARVLEVGRA